MKIQDHSDGPNSSILLPTGSGILLDAGGKAMTGEGHVPKIRKPYTITKQRERWTEEEHKKFLEALKLYGRAWRKIEEHVGSKTAVQIRSHAQKFFSKVVRESNSRNSGSIKPIEIPPPRPKRKPMHPYPRKLVIPVKKDMAFQEQSAWSASPNSSVDQEHQSPTSVLSAVASDAIGSADSSTRDGSSSPVSSHDIVSHGTYSPSGGDPMVQDNVTKPDEPVSVKLELFPKVGSFNEGSMDANSPKVFKLFGMTVLLENTEKAASSSPCLAAKLNFAVVNAEKSLNQPSQLMEVGPSAPVPMRAFCRGMPLSFIPFDNINSMKDELQVKETQEEGSWSGKCDKDGGTETQSHQCPIQSTSCQLSLAPVSQPKLNAGLKRASSGKYTRAFVPYKRSLSETHPIINNSW